MSLRRAPLLVAVGASLVVGCGSGAESGSDPATGASGTTAPSTSTTVTTLEDRADPGEPTIVVETPLPRATVTSPIVVSGISATFEGNIQVEVVDAGGTQLYRGFITSEGANGIFGPFEDSLAVDAAASGAALIRLWEDDVATGGRVSLVEVLVELVP